MKKQLFHYHGQFVQVDTNDYNCDVTDEEVNAMVKNIKAYMIYNGWIPKLF